MAAKPVQIYYIGGMEREKTESVIEVFGQTYTLPPAGGFIEVPKYVADHMMKRYNFGSRHPFTLNPRLAQGVKEGKVKRGDDALYIEVEKDYSVEELEAMLEERRRTTEEKPKAASKSRSKKSSEPELVPELTPDEEIFE